MFKTLAAASVVALGLTGAASVAPIFFDDFSGYGSATGLNAPNALFGGVWATTGGTIDYLAPPPAAFSNLCQTTGSCIDLDGSTSAAGVFSTVQLFAAGTYTLAIELFGNGRGAAPDNVTITLGSWMTTLAGILSGDNASQSFTFTTTGGALSFANAGGDNQGAVLSSVSLAAIPLPAGGLLLLGALGGLAVWRRRKTA